MMMRTGTMAVALLATALALVVPATAQTLEKGLLLENSKDWSGSYWQQNDGAGQTWRIYTRYGYTSPASREGYSSLMRMQVGGSNMYTNIRRVSQDGQELQLGPWSYSGVTVYRRIYVNKKKGYCRWIDIFHNSSGQVQTGTVRYSQGLRYGVTEILTTTGKKSVTPKDWGMVTFSTSSSYPSMVHFFGSRGTKVVPRINHSRGSSSMYWDYTLKIPAGKTVALCFFEAQISDKAKARKFLQTFRPTTELRNVSPALRKIILNMGPGVMSLGDLELARSDENDLAILVGGGEANGTIANESYSLETFYGKFTFPAATVIGFAVADATDKVVRLGLVDGQVLVGTLTSGPVKMKLANGTEMSLPLSKFQSVAYKVDAARPGEVSLNKPTIILRDGQRLYFRPADANGEFETRYGKVALKMADLRTLLFDDSQSGLHRAIFRNGSSLAGLYLPETLSVKLELEGADLKVPRPAAEALLVSFKTETPAKMARMTLSNSDYLVGWMAAKTLSIQTKFGKVVVKTNEIEGMAFEENELGQVKCRLRKGTIVTGRLLDRYIPFTIDPGPSLNVFQGYIQSLKGSAAGVVPPVNRQPTAVHDKQRPLTEEEKARIAMLERRLKMMQDMRAKMGAAGQQGNNQAMARMLEKIDAQIAELQRQIEAIKKGNASSSANPANREQVIRRRSGPAWSSLANRPTPRTPP